MQGVYDKANEENSPEKPCETGSYFFCVQQNMYDKANQKLNFALRCFEVATDVGSAILLRDNSSNSAALSGDNETTGSPPAAGGGGKADPVVVAVQLVFCCLVLIFNTIILVVISSSKNMFKTTYYFLGNLAVSDLFFGLAFLVRYVVVTIPPNSLTVHMCIVSICVLITSIGTTASGLCFLAYQTYLAVQKGQSLERAITTKKALALMASSWLFYTGIGALYRLFVTYPESPMAYKAICFVGSALYVDKTYPALIAGAFFAAYFPTVYFQIVTATGLMRRSRIIRPTQSTSSTVSTHQSEPPSGGLLSRVISQQTEDDNHLRVKSTETGSSVYTTDSVQDGPSGPAGTGLSPNSTNRSVSKGMSLNVKHRNALIIVMAILVIFTLCLCPVMFGLFVYGVCPNGCGITDRALRPLLLFSFIQSFSNCTVYIIRDKKFRQQLGKIFCCSRLQRTN